jgi:hypothetical protein
VCLRFVIIYWINGSFHTYGINVKKKYRTAYKETSFKQIFDVVSSFASQFLATHSLALCYCSLLYCATLSSFLYSFAIKCLPLLFYAVPWCLTLPSTFCYPVLPSALLFLAIIFCSLLFSALPCFLPFNPCSFLLFSFLLCYPLLLSILLCYQVPPYSVLCCSLMSSATFEFLLSYAILCYIVPCYHTLSSALLCCSLRSYDNLWSSILSLLSFATFSVLM